MAKEIKAFMVYIPNQYRFASFVSFEEAIKAISILESRGHKNIGQPIQTVLHTCESFFGPEPEQHKDES